jgi:hypothetical protein
MDKVKILKAKTFIRVLYEDEVLTFLPHDHEGFEGFEYALMQCQEDCVCQESIAEDLDFYFKLIGQRNKGYTGRCYSDLYDALGGIIDTPTFFDETPPNGLYILTSYCPSSLEDGELYGDNLIHTSDGVVEISKDNFLVNKDGELSSVEPEDVLSIFSKRKVKVSPSFKELRISNSRTRPARAATGTLIYNQTTGQLEFKGKNGWERIITENLK